MSCYHPLTAVNYGIKENGKQNIKFVRFPGWDLARYRERYGKDLMLFPCGHCVDCARDYARTWQARIMAEAEYYDKACFITLTYADNPPEKPLKEDLRKFIKKVRNKYGEGIKFFGCGEKGELNKRSHYHIILFGVDFLEDAEIIGRRGSFYTYRSKALADCWSFGYSLLGSLQLESAGYVAQYVDKKKIKGQDDGEFLIMSRGLGRKYFEDHYKEIFNSDYLYFSGTKFKIPRYFLKLALNQEDYFIKCLACDYSDRKSLLAKGFRYNSNKSMFEDLAIMDNEKIALDKVLSKGGSRDVDIYY